VNGCTGFRKEPGAGGQKGSSVNSPALRHPEAGAARQPATVFILDFGAQYSQLIARRTRELNVYCEIVPYDTPWSTLAPREPAAIVLSGGPESTLVPEAPRMDPEIIRSGVPILGICYGMQLVARECGAEL